MYEDGDVVVVVVVDADRIAVDDLKAVKDFLPIFRPHASIDAFLLFCDWMKRDKREQYPCRWIICAVFNVFVVVVVCSFCCCCCCIPWYVCIGCAYWSGESPLKP